MDLHDSFSLIRTYLESWDLPCIIICCRSCDTVTGLELLGIGSSATVNWIGSMVNDRKVMAEYFCYAGLMFTKDCCTAIVTPKHTAHPRAPENSPVPVRRPKTQLGMEAPPSAPPRIHYSAREVISDLEDGSDREYSTHFITQPDIHPPPIF